VFVGVKKGKISCRKRAKNKSLTQGHRESGAQGKNKGFNAKTQGIKGAKKGKIVRSMP